MAINLEKIRAKLDKLNGKDNHSDLFWRADAGTHTIRIIPSEDGDPMKEKHFHYNISKGGVLRYSVRALPIVRSRQRSCLLINASTPM